MSRLKPKQAMLSRDRRITYALFTLPGLLIYAIFFIFPIGLGVYYSMTDWDGITREFNFIGLENYIDIFTTSNSRFTSALWFNARYCVVLTVCIVVLGMILAILLNSKIKGITFFRAMYFIPAVLSMVTVGLIFGQIYYRVIPPIGEMLGWDLFSRSMLSAPVTAFFGIIFVNVWQGVAIPTLLFLAGLQTVPTDLYEAAELDGASKWKRFWHITLPFLVPVLSVVMVLTVKSGMCVFDYVMSMTSGGPAGSTESVSILIYSHAFTEMKYAYAVAEAIILGLIIAGISAIQISISNKKKV